MASDILSYWKFPNVQCSSLFPHTQLPQYCKVIMIPGPVALSFINELYFFWNTITHCVMDQTDRTISILQKLTINLKLP